MDFGTASLQTSGRAVARVVKGLAGVVLVLPLLAFAAKPVAAGAGDGQRLPRCSWDRPGQNPFMGDVVAAVDRYTDIPADVRARLKQRMARRDYDDIASIRRDAIEGKARYEPAIRDMHFGTGQVCTTVSRQAWLPAHQERGLVYCEGAVCIIVPTVCRNVSRIKREEPAVLAGRDLLEPDETPPGNELLFEPPGAGQLWQVAAALPPSFADAADGIDGFASAPGHGGQGAATAAFAGGAVDDHGGSVAAVATGSEGRVRLSSVGHLPDSQGSWPQGRTGLPTGGVTTVGAVPEPGTWALMLVGAAACLLRRSRRVAWPAPPA